MMPFRQIRFTTAFVKARGTDSHGTRAVQIPLGIHLDIGGVRCGIGQCLALPYIVGEYGGAAFVILYLIFLVALGIPIMVMEFAVGRASQRGIARAFDILQPKGSSWHRFKWLGVVGLYLLMMFYTTVAGWMLAYIPKMATAPFDGAGALEGPRP